MNFTCILLVVSQPTLVYQSLRAVARGSLHCQAGGGGTGLEEWNLIEKVLRLGGRNFKKVASNVAVARASVIHVKLDLKCFCFDDAV